jgi:hypothetical protein
VRTHGTISVAAVVLVSALSVACSGPGSPTAPSKPAQTHASVDPVKATSDGATISAIDPPKGVPGPSVIGFPPRNEPNAFFQDLTVLYRDFLKRPQTASTYVDPEGENVWLTEYFRFYLNGCSHQEAVSRTLAEITSGGTQPVCGQETPTFPPRNLPNEFQGQLENTYRDSLRRPQTLSYVDSEGANVWLAQYLRFRVSGCNHAVAQEKVFTEIRGGGVQPDCAPALWTITRGGDWTFDMPTSVRQVLIAGILQYGTRHFSVRIAGTLVVNVVLGPGQWQYVAVHQTSGGVVEVRAEPGVIWTLTEQR